METNDTTTTPLDEVIASYAAVREFLAQHPDLPEAKPSGYGHSVTIWLHSGGAAGDNEAERNANLRTEFARCARILMAGAPVGSIQKDATDSFQSVERTFGKVTLAVSASRDAVCTKRVIGVEKVQVPDPTAPTVEVEREIVEWVCAPILPAERLEQVPA